MPSLDMQKPAISPTSPTMRKRQRTDLPGAPSDQQPPPGPPQVGDDAFINDHDAVESGGDDDDDDEQKPKSDKKAGRRKIKIEFIQDKSRRHITFSKRKAGIMKKAYELSTLTGTQVLLLVVSETGLVYTFTTAKLQPLVTQPEGKNLIQACLNAPHGSLPSTMPVGPPLGRSSGPPVNIPGPPANIPGGLSISGSSNNNIKEDDPDDDHHDDTAASHGGRPSTGDKRRRRGSSTSGPAPTAISRGATSPHSPNASIPPPLNIPAGAPQGGQPSHPSHQQPQPQIALGSPTSPQQQHQQVSASSPQYTSPTYGHHPGQAPHHQQQQHDQAMYSPHMMSGGYTYPGPNASPAQSAQQLGGLAAAAATQHPQQHWGGQQPPVQGGGHYGRR
ncbi:SRF-type transcription factor (DNA-binding and dimerization domain)-domain-containing protein [Gymnopilus junonius]|uniref:SRF-type transcription factor (DNA-binding and dimerization domain)-domain-containing protein n=1 Tax=Gymnopilus junonius TaxID=109634 RepID=A0A9P5NK07_GYMJU|nr:SRF-type transcription factor (DNA-binding and dimerization domain)-domain-containing protein [Gymnopilus junonius]